MPPREPAESEDNEGHNGEVEAVHGRPQPRVAVPPFPEQVTHVGEGVAPRPGASKGVGLERKLRHAGDAGWQRDKGANHWQQAPDQRRRAAEPAEEPLSAVQVVRAEQDVAAPSFDQ